MDRRIFLRATATIAVAGTVLAGGIEESAAGAATSGRAARYRGTSTGRIYVSHDNGRTWKLLTYFGPNVSVSRVGPDSRQRIVAKLAYQHHGFRIALQPNGRTWHTI